MRHIYKYIFLLSIKYAPSVLALTCATKIYLLTLNDSPISPYERSVNWINWILNVLALAAFYSAGKHFNFCWKHRSLCRIAAWGYAYYAAFLLFDTPHEAIYPITTFFFILVCLLTPLYKNL